jgi:hypothetical protein
MRKRIDENGKITITESNMNFGSYSTDNFFDIEEHIINKKLDRCGVHSVEFLLLKATKNPQFPMVCMVEAKTTPREPVNKQRLKDFVENKLKTAKENPDLIDLSYLEESFNNLLNQLYYIDIKNKFNDTLSLFVAMYSNRQSNSDLPENFRKITFSTTHFALILVIKNEQAQWMRLEKSWKAMMQNRLRKELEPIVKMWNLSPNSIAVLSEDDAKKEGFITS